MGVKYEVKAKLFLDDPLCTFVSFIIVAFEWSNEHNLFIVNDDQYYWNSLFYLPNGYANYKSNLVGQRYVGKSV